MAGECGFPFIAFLDPDIAVSPLEIQFGDQFSSLQLFGSLSDKREQIVVLDCVFIKIVIILYHSLLSILFRDEEHRGGLRRFRWLDISFPGLIVDEIGDFLLFLR